MIESIPLVVTGIGLTASIVYYASILRNANKTQQQALETRQAAARARQVEYTDTGAS